MKKHTFEVSVTVDGETGETVAVYLRVAQGKVSDTQELGAGKVFADFDADGDLIGVEVVGPCEVDVLDRVAAEGPVRRFLRGSVPRGFVMA